MADETLQLSRRQVLAAAGSVGVAAAGAGLGTSAFFSDTERFRNNRLVAGELDVRAGFVEHYSNWSPDEAASLDGNVTMPSGGAVDGDAVGLPTGTAVDGSPLIALANASDAGQFLNNTVGESPDPGDDAPDRAPEGFDPATAEAIDAPCTSDLLVSDIEQPTIQLSDLKPGDFGLVRFSLVLCDNPGFVWAIGRLVDAAENGTTEPEADDPDEGPGVELLDAVRTAFWIDDGNGFQNGDETVAFSGTLRQTLAALDPNGAFGNAERGGEGLLLPGDIPAAAGGGQGANCFSAAETHGVVFAWWLPVDHANEIQSDSATFDLGFYAEQCRHNAVTDAGQFPESKLFPTDGDRNDEYGRAVAVGDDTAMVGAPNGSVYVLERGDGGWSHERTIETGADDEFGVSVAIDGDTALFSAPAGPTPRAYVYTRADDGGWEQAATLPPSDAPVSFGYEAVAIDDGTAVVSGHDAAYVYERSGGEWPSVESARLSPDTDLPAAGLALDGDVLLVGAPAVDGLRAGGPGVVSVYERDAAWSRAAVIESGAFENFGAAVALDGSHAVVGASVADGSGTAYVYDRGDWAAPIASLSASDAGDGDEFGHAVALRNGTALVGAPRAATNGTAAGAAYAFDGDGDGGWPETETRRLVPFDGDDGDAFGSGVALGPASALVGAEAGDGAESDSGAVFVFDG
jgi:predicted ribosomally synthesized peptide with SipW-like signal peptide